MGGGFDGHRNPELLDKFSRYVDAPYYDQWAEWDVVIMTDDAGFMGDVILDKMNNADEIHFNLDGFSEERYQNFLSDRSSIRLTTNKLSFWDKDTNNITNWEYYQIISNSDLFNKTIFYDQGGTIRPHDQVYRPS